MPGRIIGHMVTFNEMGRYLTATLPWLIGQCDIVVVYDDGSTDGSLEFARHVGAAATARFVWDSSFIDDESKFRAAGWDFMEQIARPETDDWIVCIDADEFLIPPAGATLKSTLDAVAADAVTFPVVETFGIAADGQPLVRTDGFWALITACRAAKWRPHGRFHPRQEGGGSIPSDWIKGAAVVTAPQILHFGYTQHEDRLSKHKRYASGRGHNRRHVDSILTTPTLVPWDGPNPLGTNRT